MGTKIPIHTRVPFSLLSVYLLLITGIFISAFNLYNYQKETIQRDEEKLFISISNLKQDQIVVWRQERLSDAQNIFSNNFIKKGIYGYLSNQNNFSYKIELQNLIDSFKIDKNYSAVMLLDSRMNIVMYSKSASQLIEEFTKDLCKQSIETKAVVLSDLHRNISSGEIYLDLIVPIIFNDKIISVMILRINPVTNLFPMIQLWPVPTKTAESLLVERENDSVVYLNELRLKKNTALRLKLPISWQNLPAAKVIRGEEGILFGKDYRGADVVAFGQKIPSTPWYIVTKIETSELFEKIKERSYYIAVIAVLFLVIITFAFWYFLEKQIHYYRRLLIRTQEDKTALENRYDYLIKYANDAMFLLDEAGNVTFGNDRAGQIYGYAQSELLNLNIKDIRDKSSWHNIDEQQKKADSQGGIVFETLHKRKDGSTLPVEVSSRTIEIAGKRYFQSIVRDISERKESEKKIFQLNRTYSFLSDVNQMIVRIKDEDKLLDEACSIAISRGGFKMAWIGMVNKLTGMFEIAAKAGFYENYLNDFSIDIADIKKAAGPTGTCLSTGGHNICNNIENDERMMPWKDSANKNGFHSSASFPIKINDKTVGTINLYSDQKNFFTEEEIKLLDEMSGDISYAIEFLKNKKKRKKSEDALRKGWERYKELFENNPNPMWIYDEQSLKFLDVNKTAIKHYGYSKSEFLLMSIKDVRPQEDIPVIVDYIELSKEDLRVSNNVRHKKKDGTIIYVEVKSNALAFAKRQKSRIVSINDVTEQKRMMDEVIIAKETAEEAINARNVFLSTMSHELRTPLIGILGYSDILATDLGVSEYAEMARGIKRGGKRLLNTLNLILDFTRIESDRLEVALKRINLVEPLKYAFSEFEGAALDKNLEYTLTTLEENLMADIDDHLFIIVIENLINNAIKFTREGSIRVVAGINEEKKIFISVSDTGIGIDEQHLDVIFEEFKQISEGINREYQGTGLGLTITEKYIEMLNGNIVVTSRVGEGSIFTVTSSPS